jgi:hypothetical protein
MLFSILLKKDTIELSSEDFSLALDSSFNNLSNSTSNLLSDAIQDLQSSITASGFKETLLDVKNPDTKKFINELLGR